MSKCTNLKKHNLNLNENKKYKYIIKIILNKTIFFYKSKHFKSKKVV